MSEFIGRRSCVLGSSGMVATSQPLASEIGVRILQKGGNAADAAVAVAAALNVTQPCSTGIGGDMFCLYYDARTQSVRGVNGSGRAPQALTIDVLRDRHGIVDDFPDPLSPQTVTVPGAAAGWVDTLSRFGSMGLAEVLEPAIQLAEKGFPVSPICAWAWQKGVPVLKRGPFGDEMLINGRAPQAGELMRLPHLARTFRTLAAEGADGFYRGRVAHSIVDLLQSMGAHCMTLDDLANHKSTFDDPISVSYRGVDVWEMPPNGQGVTALMALKILEGFDLARLPHNSPEYLHLLIEATRLAFADTRWYCADPSRVHVPLAELLSDRYADTRRALIDPARASVDVRRGSPVNSSSTVYFCVVDPMGNACSFINSNYMGFGTGLIPQGCGFTLQNRGANFSLDPSHPNALAPGKRPYHTIIPGMATRGGRLWCPFGVMGGFMQPQGHVQVMVNMIDHKMDPQAALDAARFQIPSGTGNGPIIFEEGISPHTIARLAAMGHRVDPAVAGCAGVAARAAFGYGQIICREPDSGVLWGGSDCRADGCAYGF